MAKKKVKKRDFSKAKASVVNFLKTATKVVLAIVVFTSVVGFAIVPFLHNQIDHTIAKYVWYSASIVFVSFSITTMTKEMKAFAEHPILCFLEVIGIIEIIAILSSAFLIHYYDTFYNWWWAIFVLVALFLVILTIGIRDVLKKGKECTEEELKGYLQMWRKRIAFYWLMDFFYMAIFKYWTVGEQDQTIWLVLQFAFGVICMLFIFYNLTRAFLSNASKNWLGLLQDFLWGIAITIYLIFLVPNDSLQGIILTTVSAIYGGLLTLVGVAWTIKDTNKQNKLERELQIRPYCSIRHVCHDKLVGTSKIIAELPIGCEPQENNGPANTSILYIKNIGLGPAVEFAFDMEELDDGRKHYPIFMQSDAKRSNCYVNLLQPGEEAALPIYIYFNFDEIKEDDIVEDPQNEIFRYSVKDKIMKKYKNFDMVIYVKYRDLYQNQYCQKVVLTTNMHVSIDLNGKGAKHLCDIHMNEITKPERIVQ